MLPVLSHMTFLEPRTGVVGGTRQLTPMLRTASTPTILNKATSGSRHSLSSSWVWFPSFTSVRHQPKSHDPVSTSVERPHLVSDRLGSRTMTLVVTLKVPHRCPGKQTRGDGKSSSLRGRHPLPRLLCPRPHPREGWVPWYRPCRREGSEVYRKGPFLG